MLAVVGDSSWTVNLVSAKNHSCTSDDLDGSEASETVQFSLDGAEYEIDLNDEQASELRDVLQRFPGTDTKAVRRWAIENGFNVNARGRIQQDILEKYQAAQR